MQIDAKISELSNYTLIMTQKRDRVGVNVKE